MYILGINGGFSAGYQDISAVLIHDGYVIAAIEEERLNRVKFSSGRFPFFAIQEVLKIGGITMKEVSVIATHGYAWQKEVEDKLRNYIERNFGHCPRLIRFHHHDCHIASSFYASGFSKALCFSIDGSGDGISLQVSIMEGKYKNTIYRSERPDSLGIFYSLITQFCGYTKDADEYKVMGLSSYGNPNSFDFSWLIDFKDGKLILDETYLVTILKNKPSPHREEMLFNQKFINKIGIKPRTPNSTNILAYRDIAAAAQYHFENLVLKIVSYYIEKTDIHNICLSGGSALNCVANQKLMNFTKVDAIYIQPASNDAGISLGAAWLAFLEHNIQPKTYSNTYLGSEFTDDDIMSILEDCHIKYNKEINITKAAAKFIAEGKVLGWFQGRMEYGPRALGNRSILANPCIKNMQNIVNEKIKLREGYRPFCPSVLEEDMSKYFIGKSLKSPFMTITYSATEYAKNSIPAVIHVDDTARIQTVSNSDNLLYYNLLQEFKILSGHGVLLNTSFNLSHEPIVCTPRDALASFYSSGLDGLCLGGFLIMK